MRTFQAMHDSLNRDGWPCVYWGEHGDWLVAMGRHRESDTITNCNWDSFIEMLDELDIEDAYTIERETHSLVGWVEHILINPSVSAALELSENVHNRLDDYPILDEEAFSEAEFDEHCEDWDNWGKRDLLSELQKFWQVSDKAIDLLSNYGGLLHWYDERCCEQTLCNLDEFVKDLEVSDVADLVWEALKELNHVGSES